ncbi:MAG: VCBS repeat-containing protein [Thermoguttaceae bacterium]|nr:VCBS repeat-containing protein [Thermoguttaceae bacterium]
MRSWISAGLAVLCVAASHPLLSAEPARITFKKTQLDAAFRSEGVAVADFNGDGRKDIAAGSVYYAGPDWKMHSIREEPKEFSIEQYSDAFCCFADDCNRDGRMDLIVVDIPAMPTWWFENPGASGGPWKQHVGIPVTNNESPIFVDLTGDGKREMVCGYSPDPNQPDSPDRYMVYGASGEKPNQPWPLVRFSDAAAPGSLRFYHGLGAGDVNGDGRDDVLTKEGWFEAPADRTQGPWPFRRANLGEDCAHMHAYDFDGDGDNDVLSSSAHRYGIWWHEQTPEGWKTHTIADDFSQTHAVCLADIDGDGLMDFVTGKRFWAHMGRDPGEREPALLVWFKLGRENGRPVWTRHQIDDNSGVGTQFEVTDVSGDGLLDIAVSNKKGVFYFEQVRE